MACCSCILIDIECFWLHTGAPATTGNADIVKPILIEFQDTMANDYLGQQCVNELCERQAAGALTALDNQLIQLLSRAAAKYWLIEKTKHSDSVNSAGIVLTNYGQYSNIAPDEMYAKRQAFRKSYDFALDLLYVFLYDNQAEYPCLPTECLYGHQPATGCNPCGSKGKSVRKRYNYNMGGYVNSL